MSEKLTATNFTSWSEEILEHLRTSSQCNLDKFLQGENPQEADIEIQVESDVKSRSLLEQKIEIEMEAAEEQEAYSRKLSEFNKAEVYLEDIIHRDSTKEMQNWCRKNISADKMIAIENLTKHIDELATKGVGYIE